MTALVVPLVASLSAWGRARGSFGVRGVSSLDWLWPMRSNVLGMLAAADGRPRGSDMSDLLELDYAVRQDQPGRHIVDFHTTQRRNTAGKLISSPRHDHYVGDSRYVAVVEGDPFLIDQLAGALRHPVWAPYFGRRSCPPMETVEGTVTEQPMMDALAAHPWLAAEHRRKELGRTVVLRMRRSRRGGQHIDETYLEEAGHVWLSNPDGRDEPDFMAALLGRG